MVVAKARISRMQVANHVFGWLAFVSLLALASGECVVRLDISPATKLTFAGTSQASIVPTPFPAELVETDAGPLKIGLSGSMYLKTAGSTCPTTAAEWLAAAASMQLTAAPSGFYYKPLSLFPPLLSTTVVGVPLNISNLELNMTLSSKGPAPATQDSPFRMNVNATVTHGYVYSNSPLTGGEQLQALADVTSFSTGKALLNLTQPSGAAAAAAAAKGQLQQLNLLLPEFKLEFVSKTSGVVGGRPWSGTFTFSLTGAVVGMKVTRPCGVLWKCGVTYGGLQGRVGWECSRSSFSC